MIRNIALVAILFCVNIPSAGIADTQPQTGSAPVADSPAPDPGPGRFALLIGNANYDPSSSGVDGALPNLANPCRDVTQVGGGLVKIGWKDEDVDIRCDVPYGEMVKAINKFFAKVNGDERSVALLYFAGHGIELDGHDYIFGVDARPKADEVMNELKSGLPVLQGDAIGVDMDIMREITDRVGGAVVLVFDSCRDNPLIDAMQGQSIHYIFGRNNLAASEFPYGIKIGYSTRGGHVALDGLGEISPYGDAFSSEILKPEVTINDFLDGVSTSVWKLTNTHQKPISTGDLVTPPFWCFAPCAAEKRKAELMSPGSPVVRLASSGFPWMAGSWQVFGNSRSAKSAPEIIRVAALSADVLATSPAPTTSVPTATAPVISKPKSVFSATESFSMPDPKPTDPSPTRVDVFWCSGTPGAEDNQRRANAIASEIAGIAKQNQQVNSSPIDRVRVRELPASVNDRPGYKVVGDQIRYDATDQTELGWSGILSKTLSDHLKPVETTHRTVGYLSAFACDLSLPSPQP